MAISPLFDIYDPDGTIRQRAMLGLGPEEDEELDIIGAFPVKRRPQISDLMPQEEQRGLLRSLASAGSSGLAGLGWILDTPGSMVRGLLSGGPSKAISALWDTTEERVDGRELLRQYGLVGDDDTWGNFGGGLAAEMLLDPLTYASFGLNQVLGQGAKTAAGKAAAKAGLLQNADVLARQARTGTRQFLRNATPESLLSQLADDGAREAARRKIVAEAGEGALSQRLTRSNRTWTPWGGEGATDLYGEKAGDWLAWAGDELNKQAMTNPYTGPVARQLVRAFDPAVMGQTDYARQWEAREITGARRARESADRLKLAGLQYDAEKALGAAGKSLNDQDVSAAIRTYLETGSAPEGMEEILSLPGVRSLTGFFEGYRDYAPDAAKKLGIPLEVLRPREGGYVVPRQQTRFDVPELPKWPDGALPPDRRKSPWGKGPARVDLSDRAGGRRDYTAVTGATDTLNRLSLDKEFQDMLRRTTPENTQQAIRDHLGGDDLYQWLYAVDDAGDYIHSVPDLPADHPMLLEKQRLTKELIEAGRAGELHRTAALESQLADLRAQTPDPREYYKDQMYRKLGDMYRYLDPQHVERGIPLFGGNTFNTIADYVVGRGRAEATGDSMLDILARNAKEGAAETIEGGVNMSAKEALKTLGYTEDAIKVLEERAGKSIDGMSFNKKFVQQWTDPILKGRAPEELNPLLELADNYTKTFKTLALASPARLTRDAYSGAFAGAMLNSFNLFDWIAGAKMRSGNYKPLTEGMLGGIIPPRLAKGQYAEVFANEGPEAALKKFLVDAGGQGLGTSTVSDEALEGSNAMLREAFPGGGAPASESLLDRFARAKVFRGWNPLRSDYSPFATRTASGNRNPFLEMFDRAAETTDAGNRYGTYLNSIRQNNAPVEASRIANLTQVDYRPQAFTDFERRYLKRIMPFYSYTRGILPLIADEIVNRPAGRMGQSIRAINRAGAPSEDNFVPEYLRQSAAIPLPSELPFPLNVFGLGDGSSLKRFLTNIDLPFESAINLITPGVGNNLYQQTGNTLAKTALNLLGQTNPLLKGPLELVTNRQFYSGRQLSDLYSMLEQSLGAPGRPLEQVIVNAPGGSRLLSTIRQLSDDRLDPSEKYSKFLVNALTGLKFQDVDMERTRRLAARDMLNELLSTTPGVRTYENITVPNEVLQTMPEEQRQMYLLYKIIQSAAAKRAREKKKQQMALDPLELLGVVQGGSAGLMGPAE